MGRSSDGLKTFGAMRFAYCTLRVTTFGKTVTAMGTERQFMV